MLGSGLVVFLLGVAPTDDVPTLRMRVETLERQLEHLHARLTAGMPTSPAQPLLAQQMPLDGRRLQDETTSMPTFEMIGEGSRLSFGQLGMPGSVLLQHSDTGMLSMHGSLNITTDVVVNGVSFAQLVQTCQSVC